MWCIPSILLVTTNGMSAILDTIAYASATDMGKSATTSMGKTGTGMGTTATSTKIIGSSSTCSTI